MTAGSDLAGLVRRGLAVFPLPPGSKEAAPGWHRQCTADPAAAAGWPTGSNTGVGCRASSIVGLDLDRHAGKPNGVASFACLCGEHGAGWPSTFTVATPSGGLQRLSTPCHFQSISPWYLPKIGRILPPWCISGPPRRLRQD